MNTDLDTATFDSLSDAFATARYDRPSTSFRPPSRMPAMIAVGVATAAVASAVIIGTDGARSPAMAWSPTPIAASAQYQAQVAEVCASVSTEAPFPATLPAPEVFTMTGNAGFAVFDIDDATVTCMVRAVGSTLVPLVGSYGPAQQPGTEPLTVRRGAAWQPDNGQGSGSVGFNGDGSAGWGGDFTNVPEFAMVSGTVRDDVVAVRMDVDGLDPTTINVTNGTFAGWWPTTTAPVTLHPLDANGNDLGAVTAHAPTHN